MKKASGWTWELKGGERGGWSGEAFPIEVDLCMVAVVIALASVMGYSRRLFISHQ